jgi:hypothetical protein
MAIFNSYVKLPEGISHDGHDLYRHYAFRIPVTGIFMTMKQKAGVLTMTAMCPTTF